MFKQCLSSLHLKRTYHYTIKFVSNLRQIMCFVSVSSGFVHDIAEILLEVAIKTLTYLFITLLKHSFPIQ